MTRVELTKLIHATPPVSYLAADEMNNLGYGKMYGFPNEQWWWDDALLNRASDHLLEEIYKKILEINERHQ